MTQDYNEVTPETMHGTDVADVLDTLRRVYVRNFTIDGLSVEKFLAVFGVLAGSDDEAANVCRRFFPEDDVQRMLGQLRTVFAMEGVDKCVSADRDDKRQTYAVAVDDALSGVAHGGNIAEAARAMLNESRSLLQPAVRVDVPPIGARAHRLSKHADGEPVRPYDVGGPEWCSKPIDDRRWLPCVRPANHEGKCRPRESSGKPADGGTN